MTRKELAVLVTGLVLIAALALGFIAVGLVTSDDIFNLDLLKPVALVFGVFIAIWAGAEILAACVRIVRRQTHRRRVVARIDDFRRRSTY